MEVTITDAGRKATLAAGSVFFDVAHDEDRPFTVNAGPATVRVLGTAFDLQRKGDALHVAVREGSVRVLRQPGLSGVANNAPDASVTLTPGESVVASRAEGVGPKTSVPVGDVGAWRAGQLVYVRASLAEIVDDLRRYADKPISLDDRAAQLRLSGTFKSDDVAGVLAALEAALPINIAERDGAQEIELKE